MFKKTSAFLVIIVFILLAGCSTKVLTARPLAIPGNDYSLSQIIDKSVEQLPTELVVYKVIPYQYDEATVKNIAGKLGLSGAVQDHDSFYLITTDTKRFTVDKYSGSYSLMSDLPIEKIMQPLKEGISDATYIEMANKVIAETGIKRDGLTDTPFVYNYRKASYVDDATGKETEILILKGVTYRYKELNGTKVEGVAPKLTIAFNAQGEVTEILNPWSYYKEDASYPLISKSTALEMLQKLDNRNATVQGFDVNDTFTINSIRVVYFNDPIGYDPLYLIPFYCMEGTNSKGNPATGYVRAIDEKYIKVENPPIYQDSQPEPKRTEEPINVEPQGTSKGTSPEGEQAAAGGKAN